MLLSSYTDDFIEVGIDEVGRGAIAGPVVVGAVILPKKFTSPDIRDSKQMSPIARKKAAEIIYQKALDFSIATVSNEIIEAQNIVRATQKGMREVVKKLRVKPKWILVDGLQKFDTDLCMTAIIKGDQKLMSIAAASIIAKNYRDTLMQYWHKSYPEYNWKNNVGYPTQEHRNAVDQFGLSPIHRKTFAPCHLYT